ncbi:MAG: hypothetical protein Q8L98_03745 [Chlamydiales bacterium]|nr:hypothetical protein [Chlamydiales bacterium]
MFVFGASIFHALLHQLISCSVKVASGGQFTYKAVEWRSGNLVFLDVLFSQGVSSDMNVEIKAPSIQVTISPFSWVCFLDIKSPTIAIHGEPTFGFNAVNANGGRWIDWRWKVTDALLNWPAMKMQARVVGEKLAPRQVGRFSLESGVSHVQLEMFQEQQAIKFDACLSNIQALQLQPWLKLLGYDIQLQEGIVDGRIYFESLKGLKGSAYLEFSGLAAQAYGADIGATNALLDWESGRIRCECSSGFWKLQGRGFTDIEGQISYYSDLGAKGEVKALGQMDEESSPVAASLKGFWSSYGKPWLEVECLFPGGQCLVNSDFTNWTVAAQHIGPFWGNFVKQFVPIDWLHSWIWDKGDVSCLVHGSSHLLNLENLEASELKVSNEGVVIGCEKATLHFASEHQEGAFSIDGLFGEGQLWSGESVRIAEVGLSGQIDAGRMISHWQGPEGKHPLSLQLDRQDHTYFLSFEGEKWAYSDQICLDRLIGHVTIEPNSWTIDYAHADLMIGEQNLQLEVAQGMKQEGTLSFDVRARQGYWDLLRLVGEEREGKVLFDPQRTQFLGSFLQISPCFWKNPQEVSLHLELPWSHMLLLDPIAQTLGVSIPPAMKKNLSGFIQFDIDYQKEQRFAVDMKGDKFLWQDQAYPWKLKTKRLVKNWQMEFALEDKSSLSCFLELDQALWVLKEGKGSFFDQMSCDFYGHCDSLGRGQLVFTECAINPCYFLTLPWSSNMQGRGCVTFDLSSLDYEIDFDVREAKVQAGLFQYEHKKPVHAFFAPSKGLMIQGIDGHINIAHQYVGECQINLLHLDPSRTTWFLTHAHVHCPGEMGAILHQAYPEMPYINTHQELDFIGDIQCSSDLSKVSCFIKDGFFLIAEKMRHVQNVSLDVDEKKILCDVDYVYQNHPLHLCLAVEKSPAFSGCLTIEDQEYLRSEEENPLTVGWSYDPYEGLLVDSIKGSLGGMEACFYLEKMDDYSHLIGSASFDFHKLSKWAPPSLAEVFTELDMGKGYQLRGRLQMDRKDLSRLFFQGTFSGKRIELLGFEFRSFLSHMDIKPEEIKIDGIKISDSAGFFAVDHLVLKEGPIWTFTIPLLFISEFRPTMLKSAKGDPGQISPLVIRSMTFRELQGALDSKQTYTSHGELHFINSYKRERTIFDIPSEILGRIIGLDLELLIPVCGTVRYVLKDGALRIAALEDAYSEGGRSQFFFVEDGSFPSLDLEGNLHIQVAMKQYVLFKLTEGFSIFVDGKLNRPQYHLQKKRSF